MCKYKEETSIITYNTTTVYDYDNTENDDEWMEYSLNWFIFGNSYNFTDFITLMVETSIRICVDTLLFVFAFKFFNKL